MVNRQIQFELDGQTYIFEPSMKNLRFIDSQLAPHNIMSVIVGSQNVSLSYMSLIISLMVRLSGGAVEEDRVYRVLYKDLVESGGERPIFLHLYSTIIDMITPPEEMAKNSTSPEPKEVAGENKEKE